MISQDVLRAQLRQCLLLLGELPLKGHARAPVDGGKNTGTQPHRYCTALICFTIACVIKVVLLTVFHL